MKADQIIKNAKIFTSDKNNPQATALVVKDGKFVYVGDEAGLSAYEGKVTDLGGKFIMPGIIDSHVHITIPVGFEYAPMGERIEPDGKQAALDIMADYIKKNPGEKRYRFYMEKRFLKGEDIVKEELDAICPDAELQIQEGEGHSIWVNSKILERHGITDETPDPIPGLAYYVRKDGHVTGNMYEGATEVRIILDSGMELTDEQVDAALQRWIDFAVEYGVSAVFDAGLPGDMKFHEKVYKRLVELDKQGKLPVYVDGCLVVNSERDAEEGLKQLKRIQREYNTEHLKVHTMKIFMDGTQKIHTAAMVTPYVDVHTTGATAFSAEGIARLLKELNEANLDLHLHTVGERASRTVLDGVEMAKKEMGDDLHVRVTCAHLEIQDDDDLEGEKDFADQSQPLFEAGLTPEIGNDILRPQHHRGSHCRKMNHRIDVEDRRQPCCLQDSPQQIRDIVSQHPHQEMAVALPGRRPVFLFPQNIPVADEQDDGCQYSDNRISHNLGLRAVNPLRSAIHNIDRISFDEGTDVVGGHIHDPLSCIFCRP